MAGLGGIAWSVWADLNSSPTRRPVGPFERALLDAHEEVRKQGWAVRVNGPGPLTAWERADAWHARKRVWDYVRPVAGVRSQLHAHLHTNLPMRMNV